MVLTSALVMPGRGSQILICTKAPGFGKWTGRHYRMFVRGTGVLAIKD